jgi:hypothetical protein
VTVGTRTERRTIYLYDERRAEWRDFTVAPDDHFVPSCKNGLHQFAPAAPRCACGVIALQKET